MRRRIAQGGSAFPKTMADKPLQAQILGGKAATTFANALRSRRGDRST